MKFTDSLSPICYNQENKENIANSVKTLYSNNKSKCEEAELMNKFEDVNNLKNFNLKELNSTKNRMLPSSSPFFKLKE